MESDAGCERIETIESQQTSVNIEKSTKMEQSSSMSEEIITSSEISFNDISSRNESSLIEEVTTSERTLQNGQVDEVIQETKEEICSEILEPSSSEDKESIKEIQEQCTLNSEINEQSNDIIAKEEDESPKNKEEVNIETSTEIKEEINIKTSTEDKSEINIETSTENKDEINIRTSTENKVEINTSTSTSTENNEEINIRTSTEDKQELNIETSTEVRKELNIETLTEDKKEINNENINQESKVEQNLNKEINMEKPNETLEDHDIQNANDMNNEDDRDGDEFRHTWKPKGNYELKKTEITYEDVVPCKIPDVDARKLELQQQQKQQLQQQQLQQQQLLQSQINMDQQFSSTERASAEHTLEGQKFLRHAVISGEPISPLEIPIGIPLLAKILPRDEVMDGEHHAKISLERLFTPATDVESIAPQSKKRAYASSCFYRPEHPTIDDQVELAHKISFSLVDENNKLSKGQTMYMKRKNRSSKWVHQESQSGAEEYEEESTVNEPQRLKLVIVPKEPQSITSVQRHYEDLISTRTESTQHFTRMEVGMEIAAHLESPTGKGAELFARRKKRMDKFIVDETTLQQQHDQQHQHQQQQENGPVNQIKSPEVDFSANLSVQTNADSFQMENSTTTQSTMESASSLLENISTSNQGEGAMYTAQVEVYNNPSFLATDISQLTDTSLHKLKLETITDRDEKKFKSFNLAPKGWGTYNDFYKPIHVGFQ